MANFSGGKRKTKTIDLKPGEHVLLKETNAILKKHLYTV